MPGSLLRGRGHPDPDEQNRGDRAALCGLLAQQGFQFAELVLLVEQARQHHERLGITLFCAARQQAAGFLTAPAVLEQVHEPDQGVEVVRVLDELS